MLAVEYARVFRGRVVILHVIPPTAFPEGTRVLPVDVSDPIDLAEYVSARARRLLDEHFSSVLTAGAEVRKEARSGNAVETILRAIEECGAKLVVVGTHGRTGVARLVLGSVAEEVLRRSPVPVMLVHEPVIDGQEHNRAFADAATLKKILVPIDFGPASDAAVEQAVTLASASSAELTLLHVYEAPVFAYPGAPFIAIEDISIALEKSARAGIDTVVHQLTGRVPRVAGLIRQGSAWRHINEVAQEIRADLLVLGTHGRQGVPRALIGSVAEKVVRTSLIPVLTVHAAESTVATPART